MKKLSWVMALLVTVAVLLPVLPVGAVPPQPHRFYGNVSVGGAGAVDGLPVGARIGGVLYAQTTTMSVATTDNGQPVTFRYGAPTDRVFTVPGDDSDTSVKDGGRTGETIQFFVDQALAGSFTGWELGGSNRLDLSVDSAFALKATLSVSPASVMAGQPVTAQGIVKNFDEIAVGDSTVVLNWGDGGSSST